ncbi:MAG: hypothetical protein U1G07_25385 [Verrucomicrobiota bacterium]
MDLALGAGKAPRCLHCLAALLEQPPDELAQHLYNYCQTRPCYAAAWKFASGREGVNDDGIPQCVWGGSGSKEALDKGRE